MITETEQSTLDIDWFFTNNEDIAFVASAGGKLPNSVASSSENHKLLVSFFRSLPIISEVAINPSLTKIISNISDKYLADFRIFSQKGLFSFDKTKTNSFSNTRYHLVTKPLNALKFNQLPFGIKEILAQSKYDGDLDMFTDSTFVT